MPPLPAGFCSFELFALFLELWDLPGLMVEFTFVTESRLYQR